MHYHDKVVISLDLSLYFHVLFEINVYYPIIRLLIMTY